MTRPIPSERANRAAPGCAAQDRAVQDRAVQDRAAQDRAVQDRAVQDRAVQDRAAQDRPTQDRVETPLRSVKGAMPEPVKVGLRRSTRTFGRVTHRWRTHPDFLIIGTKRGGTTSLWNAMLGHADVLPLFPGLQEMKSPHYFDIDYWRGDCWYRSFFPTYRQRARHLRRTGHHAIAGEASPYYMFHPLAADRIAKDVPRIKLIVSLRNPVDRIWSHYNERVAGHSENLAFEQALAVEGDRLAGEVERIEQCDPNYYSRHHDLSSYLARGRYWEHLSRFVARFGPDQLLVLRAEDFYANPRDELAKVARHLDIHPARFGEVAHYNRIPRDTLAPDVRARLTAYYRPHVAELQSGLDRDFGWAGFQ